MFEIGNSLQEARVRQGIDLRTAEVATKVRAKYLEALEDEHFELLPAQTYVKGFLRVYAEFLGLDGQLYVDEYTSRFVAGEDGGRPLRPRRSRARPQRRAGGLESRAVMVTLAAICVVAALVIVAWRSGDGNDDDAAASDAAAQTHVRRHPVRPTTAHLVITARSGNSLLEVHADSAAGRLLFQGTLLRGKSVPFTGKRLWVDATAPKRLVASLNGARVKLPGGGPLLVTPDGVRRATA